MKKTVLLLVGFLFVLSSYGQLTYWTNANGTGLWSDPLNWSLGVVPDTAQMYQEIRFDADSSNANCLIDYPVMGNIFVGNGYSGVLTQGAGVNISCYLSILSPATFNCGSDTIRFSHSSGYPFAATGLDLKNGVFNQNNSVVLIEWPLLMEQPGVFNGGSSKIFLKGLSSYGGIFNATTDTMVVSAGGGFALPVHSIYFADPSVIFNHNNGTIRLLVDLPPTWAAFYTSIGILTQNIHFNNIIMELANYSANPNLYFDIGFYVYGQTGLPNEFHIDNDLTIAKGNFIGKVILEGNLILGDSARMDSGEVVFVSPNNQYIFVEKASTAMPGIVVDKPSGTVTIDALSDTLRITHLNLKNGEFIQNGHLIVDNTLSDSARIVQVDGGTYTFGSSNLALELSGDDTGEVYLPNGPVLPNLIISTSRYDSLTTDIAVSGTLQIKSGQLKAGINNITTNNLDNDGLLYLSETGSLVQEEGGIRTGSGNTSVERTGHFEDTVYNIWSSPVQSVDLLATSGSNACNIYAFEGSTQQWRLDYTAGTLVDCNGQMLNITPGMVLNPSDGVADGLMDAGRGYFITGNTSDQRVFTGPANNGTLNFPIFTTGLGNNPDWTGDDWNLTGNPYPSAISLDSFWAENAVDNPRIQGAIYLWDDDKSGGPDYDHVVDYAVWNATGPSSGSGNNPGKVPSGYISSGQGFWVDALATGNVVFKNSMRKTGNNTQFFKTDSHAFQSRIWVRVKKGSYYSNQALFGFDNIATTGYDTPYDAHVLESDTKLGLWSTHGNEDFVIQALPEIKFGKQVTIPLHLKTSFTGVHVFYVDSVSFNGRNYPTYLYDKVLDKTTLLSETYAVLLEKGDYRNRFYLTVKNEVKESELVEKPTLDDDKQTTTGIETAESESLNFWTNSGFIYVDAKNNSVSKINLYDMRGALLLSKGYSGTSGIIELPSKTESAIYLLKVTYTDASGASITQSAKVSLVK